MAGITQPRTADSESAVGPDSPRDADTSTIQRVVQSRTRTMLSLFLVVAPLLLAPNPTLARLLHSLPEDPHAFPKSRIAFLNSLPVLNQTAAYWLSHGLRGGELEFTDQPWKDTLDATTPSIPTTANYSLERLKMGPKHSYLCLIPQPADHPPSPPEEEPSDELVPSRSWSLLQPLTGTCLYHRQGWFTYSYCHNDEIRQFKESTQAHPHAAGGYKPEEDPEWEAYSLGKAPKPGVDLSVAEQDARAANLELARNAGSRYLVQRWGDGTLCDKTGRSREVEVQFHCSMTMTDTILFVKEAKTCSYVVVIHTPRLCGEPGFKSRRDTGEETPIRCRQIVDVKPEIPTPFPDADHPPMPLRKKPALPPPLSISKASEGKDKAYDELLRKAVTALMGGGKDGKGKMTGDEEVVIEVLGEDTMTETQAEAVEKLTTALRAAGYDIKSERMGDKDDRKKSTDKGSANKKGKKQTGAPRRDEL